MPGLHGTAVADVSALVQVGRGGLLGLVLVACGVGTGGTGADAAGAVDVVVVAAVVVVGGLLAAAVDDDRAQHAGGLAYDASRSALEAGRVHQAEAGGQDGGADVVLAAETDWKKRCEL